MLLKVESQETFAKSLKKNINNLIENLMIKDFKWIELVLKQYQLFNVYKMQKIDLRYTLY